MSTWSIPGMRVGEAYHWQNLHSIRETQRNSSHQILRNLGFPEEKRRRKRGFSGNCAKKPRRGRYASHSEPPQSEGESRGGEMKSITRTLGNTCLLLAMAMVAPAARGHECSMARASGTYGFALTGVLITS